MPNPYSKGSTYIIRSIFPINIFIYFMFYIPKEVVRYVPLIK